MLNIRSFLGLSFYISELDQFLNHFDQKHPALSVSQRKEKEKYARIYALRDNPTPACEESFWNDF